MPTHKISIPVELPVSYFQEGEGEPVLVLHGYSDNAFAARRRLLGTEPIPGIAVLAPNAPFPCPNWRNEKYHEGYAWYFRDSETGNHLIHPELGARAALRLVDRIGLADKTWTIVGFSQGGFFAPHLVRAGLKVKRLIAVGSGFRPEAFEGLNHFEVRAIHGDADDIVPLEASQKSFAEIKAMGYGTEFHVMPGVGHRLDETGRAVVRAWLASG